MWRRDPYVVQRLLELLGLAIGVFTLLFQTHFLLFVCRHLFERLSGRSFDFLYGNYGNLVKDCVKADVFDLPHIFGRVPCNVSQATPDALCRPYYARVPR